MDNKALYLLAQFDDNTQEILAGYYEILRQQGFIGRQTKNIPYHFTLGSYGTEHEENLKIKLDEVCRDFKPIEIKLDHLGLFGMNVLFVEPNMNFELLQLQNSFFSNCGNGFHPWTAHATILLDEPDEILRAVPILAANFKPFKACIESVALYEFFPTRFIKKCELYG